MRGTILGVPRIRTIVFGGLYWGPPILGNYHIGVLRALQGLGAWSRFMLKVAGNHMEKKMEMEREIELGLVLGTLFTLRYDYTRYKPATGNTFLNSFLHQKPLTLNPTLTP